MMIITGNILQNSLQHCLFAFHLLQVADVSEISKFESLPPYHCQLWSLGILDRYVGLAEASWPVWQLALAGSIDGARLGATAGRAEVRRRGIHTG